MLQSNIGHFGARQIQTHNRSVRREGVSFDFTSPLLEHSNSLLLGFRLCGRRCCWCRLAARGNHHDRQNQENRKGTHREILSRVKAWTTLYTDFSESRLEIPLFYSVMQQ